MSYSSPSSSSATQPSLCLPNNLLRLLVIVLVILPLNWLYSRNPYYGGTVFPEHTDKKYMYQMSILCSIACLHCFLTILILLTWLPLLSVTICMPGLSRLLTGRCREEGHLKIPQKSLQNQLKSQNDHQITPY